MDNSYQISAPGSHDGGSVNSAKEREKQIFITEVLRDINSKIPVEQVIAFEKFLKDTETDTKIDYFVDRHQMTYKSSIDKVAREGFLPLPGVNIDALLEIHSMINVFSKNSDFRQHVQEIMDIATASEPSNGPLSHVLEEIENEQHIDKFSVEEISQYTMKNMNERLAFWESRYLANDPRYKELQRIKSMRNTGE
jgi:hypothetical protein